MKSWGASRNLHEQNRAANDPMAVLDSRFRVSGTEGRAVVDASVFPRFPVISSVSPLGGE